MPEPLARITPVPIDSVEQVIHRSVPLPEPEIDEHTVARAIQDLIVVARIEKRLFEENLLQRLAVQVTASEGEVVLTGRATSEMQKRKVEELVQRVPGVQRLENRIDVP
jgi:osmotically-inducible protein OsmY